MPGYLFASLMGDTVNHLQLLGSVLEFVCLFWLVLFNFACFVAKILEIDELSQGFLKISSRFLRISAFF